MKKQIKSNMKSLLLTFFAGIVLGAMFSICMTPEPTPRTVFMPASTAYEYHMDIDLTGYDVFNDKGEHIGRVPYGEGRTLDSIFIADNE